MDLKSLLQFLEPDKEPRAGDVKKAEQESYQLQRELRGPHEASIQYPVGKDTFGYNYLEDKEDPEATVYKKQVKDFLKRYTTVPEDKPDQVLVETPSERVVNTFPKTGSYFKKYIQKEDVDGYEPIKEELETDRYSYVNARLRARNLAEQAATKALLEDFLKEKYENPIDVNTEKSKALKRAMEEKLGITPVELLVDTPKLEASGDLGQYSRTEDKITTKDKADPATLLHELIHARDVRKDGPHIYSMKENNVTPPWKKSSFEEDVYQNSSGHHTKPGIGVYSEVMDMYQKALEDQGFAPFKQEGESVSDDTRNLIPVLKQLLKKEYDNKK